MLRSAIVTMVPMISAWAAALSSERIRKETEEKVIGMTAGERLDQLIDIFSNEPWLRKMDGPSKFDLTQEDVNLVLQALAELKARELAKTGGNDIGDRIKKSTCLPYPFGDV